ncbi:hypothetical protein JQF37_11040 [Pseudomonas sp. MIL9]|uniref:hypothetical protein n=1 Tax=Pseudomonas sp. MIL9 TaxID=2807620 RepID=UPI00194F0E4D|nr:hypothetical protein [Pseudomonas sp. MIL9]MBM6444152.1 hypothetical protein [Pseudomonas sp. MIL9]
MDQPIKTMHACVFFEGRSDRTIPVTYGALIDYFDAASAGQHAQTIATTSGPIPATNVLIWRKWIERFVDEATERAENAAGFAQPANDSASIAMVANTTPANSKAAKLPHLSGSAPFLLQIQQARLRQQGEDSASEQLASKQQLLDQAILEAAKWKAMYETAEMRLQVRDEELEKITRELSAKHRALVEAEDENIHMEEQLEEAMALAEIIRPDNEFSPPELRQMVMCCRELSRDCTIDVVAEKGIGLRMQVKSWLEKRIEKPAINQIDRFATALTLLSHKKGGAPTRNKQKNG